MESNTKTRKIAGIMLLAMVLVAGLFFGCQSEESILGPITLPAEIVTTAPGTTNKQEPAATKQGGLPVINLPAVTQPTGGTAQTKPLTEEEVEDFFHAVTTTYNKTAYLRTPEDIAENNPNFLWYTDLLKQKKVLSFAELNRLMTPTEKEELQKMIELGDDYMGEDDVRDPSKTFYSYQNLDEVQQQMDALWGAGRMDVAKLTKMDVYNGSYGYLTADNILLERYLAEDETYEYASYFSVQDIAIDGDRAVIRAQGISVAGKAYFSEYGYAIDETDHRIVGKMVENGWRDTNGNMSMQAVAQALEIDTDTLGSYVFSVVRTADGLQLENVEIEPYRSFGAGVVTPSEVFQYGYHCEVGAEVGLNLRKGPGTSHDVIVILPYELRISELGYNDGGWIFVSATVEGKEYYGWVTNEFVNFYDGMAKPVIYLYPEKETDVSVQVAFTTGGFTCTYPDYGTGWQVTAQPDGTLHNKADGREYSYLYWEGEGHVSYDMSHGFVVPGDDTAAFLQEKLAYMGFTPREYNEFIVYWLPLMHRNPYNLITFQTTAYTDAVDLQILPQPDSMLRVYMVYQPLEEYRAVPQQELVPFAREGFSVVEWGGTEYGK